MKIIYKFNENYLKELASGTNLSRLLESPEGELVFIEKHQTLITNPDIFFEFFDWTRGELENLKENQEYKHDIWGTPYDIVYNYNQLKIINRKSGQIEFCSEISYYDLISILNNLAKDIKTDIEEAQSEVKNNTVWKSYYFNNQKKGEYGKTK